MQLTKEVNLAALETELIAAGLTIHGLGTSGTLEDDTEEIHTYTDAGEILDLPEGAAAVIAAHVPPDPPPNPWSVLRSLITYADGPEDVLDLMDMQCQLQGG